MKHSAEKSKLLLGGVSLAGWIAAGAYVATVYAANYAVDHWGVVSVGFGLVAPAGVFAAGAALVWRDVIQHELGRLVVVGAILVGAALSYALGAGGSVPGGHASIAVASGAAFLLSEFADLAVYTPIRRRGWAPAVVASNVVGAVVDSAVFLWLAFGGFAFLKGQVVGKLWVTALAVALLALLASRRREYA